MSCLCMYMYTCVYINIYVPSPFLFFMSFYDILFVFIPLVRNITFNFTGIPILVFLKTALSLLWAWVKQTEKVLSCFGNYSVSWQLFIVFQGSWYSSKSLQELRNISCHAAKVRVRADNTIFWILRKYFYEWR